MGKITGFMEFERHDRGYRAVEERLQHWREFVVPLSEADPDVQASRCMDCGIPYCHTGCPVNNQIPDWNDLVYREQWRTAARNLHSTNNFPEMTGRVCPAPCEAACTLNIDDKPVTIKTIECSIADKAFAEGWVAPEPAGEEDRQEGCDRRLGPGGPGRRATVGARRPRGARLRQEPSPGGLLRYGIPDFKMEKSIVERRVKQMEAEGVVFHSNAHVGRDLSAPAAGGRA